MKSYFRVRSKIKAQRMCFLLVVAFFAIGGCTTTHVWEPKDMNSRVGRRVEVELQPDSVFCLAQQCKFDLHYFFGKEYEGPDPYTKTDSTPARDGNKKWVLFIPGGPGEIVDRGNPDLDEPRRLYYGANVVYFDVRGMGFSTILESNYYDRFLRSKYVVEDIETLRKHLLRECSAWEAPLEAECKEGVTPWDAIYAHSWGTIVAQKYAAKYPDKVTKLILSAPVSRAFDDTEPARRKMIVDNLIDILQGHRTASCWSSYDLVARESSPLPPPELVDDFCFFGPEQLSRIEDVFFTLLNNIERDYGSINLVHSFYDRFRDDEKSGFLQRYPYPEEFFRAIQSLVELGAGPQPRLRLGDVGETKAGKIGAALYLSYYLLLPREALKDTTHELYPGDPKDTISGPNCERAIRTEVISKRIKDDTWIFFKGRIQGEEWLTLRRNLCNRVVTAWKSLAPNLVYNRHNRSARARTVFSVNDGLARWIFQIMKGRVENGCLRVKDIQDVADGDPRLNSSIRNSKVIREEAKKLVGSITDKICAWDPGLIINGKKEYGHEVDTLILKGGADPVIAGGQAEYLFEQGLTPEKRALIEFPGVGHMMNYQIQPLLELEDDENKYIQKINQFWRDIVTSFVNSASMRDFTQNEKAKEAIRMLGACLRLENNICMK